PAAKLRELGGFGGVDVEANDLEAGLEQAMHKRLAQQAEADKAYWLTIWHEPHPSQTVANRRHPCSSCVRHHPLARAVTSSGRFRHINQAVRCRDRAPPSRDCRAGAWAWECRSWRDLAA